MKQVCNIVFDTDTNEYLIVNTETNTETPLFPKKPASKSKTKAAPTAEDTSESPKVTLEENKVVLNTAATTLLGIAAGDNVAISYIKVVNKGLVPAIGKAEALNTKGNKLTKSLTLACRGKAHDELSNFGTEFTLEASSQDNVYLLIGNKTSTATEEETPADDFTPDPEVIEELSQLNGSEFDGASEFLATDLASLLN